MKRGIIAVVVALGAVVMPGVPALADHCRLPGAPPDPLQNPLRYAAWQLEMVEYIVCELTHR